MAVEFPNDPNLPDIIELKNITQVELATSLKKPQSYIAKVENLDRRIDVLELHDWLSALDKPIDEFLACCFER